MMPYIVFWAFQFVIVFGIFIYCYEARLKSYCSEIQHRFIPAVHIQHTILS